LNLVLAASLACHSTHSIHFRLLIYTAACQEVLRDFITRYKQTHPKVDVQFLDMGSNKRLIASAKLLSATASR